MLLPLLLAPAIAAPVQQAPLLPGTGEGLTLATGIGSVAPDATDAKTAAPGDDLAVVLSSADPGLDGGLAFLAVGFGPSGGLPVPTLPGIALDLQAPLLQFSLGTLAAATPTTLDLALPGDLPDVALFLQGIVLPLDPGAVANGLFASSDGHRIDVESAGPVVVTEDLVLSGVDTTVGDNFGFDVDLRDGRIAVGAPFANTTSLDTGVAYLFDLATGSQLGQVSQTFGFLGDNFGNSVALTDDSLYVGVPRVDAVTTLSGAIRRYSLGGGQLVGSLFPVGSAGESPVGHSLGEDISIAGDVLVSGARGDSFLAPGGGSAQLFDASTGAFLGKVFPSDPAFADNFGSSVAASGPFVVVGSPFDDVNADDSGSAYVFDSGTGAELFELSPDDTGANDLFGEFVAADGDTALIGAPFLNGPQGEINLGAVYVYRIDTGELVARLDSPAPVEDGRFGDGLAIDGDHVLIGESFGVDSNGVNSGVVYVYDRTTLELIARLEASAGATADALGESIAIDGDRVVVGARGSDTLGDLAGAAYVFTLP